jgi:hypothetical protein
MSFFEDGYQIEKDLEDKVKEKVQKLKETKSGKYTFCFGDDSVIVLTVDRRCLP